MNTIEKDPTCKSRIDSHLKGREEDFLLFMGCEDLGEAVSEELGSFFDYGLCFDLVEAHTFDNQEKEYYRYQLSWGGPSDEIRFFEDGTIEYWFLDWFDGAKKDITKNDWAIWLRDCLTEGA